MTGQPVEMGSSDTYGFVNTAGPERYRLRRSGADVLLHDDQLGADIIKGSRGTLTGHLEWQLLGIAAAILNGRVPPEDPESRYRRGADRYITEYIPAHHADDPKNAIPCVSVSDRMKGMLILLSAITKHDCDATNFRAMAALDLVTRGLNALGFDWAESNTNEDQDGLKLAIPRWALPRDDRQKLVGGGNGSWVAQLGTPAAGTRHGWFEVRRMPIEEPVLEGQE